jgi:phosphoribosylaminoimidazolecarboxamide formyltransferase / IMP cyclohydrolase
MPVALISVSNKSGIVDFARGLVAKGYELLSTGGTLRALQEADLPATGVDSYTGSPEVMAGRVKTLHPRIHGGILARLGTDEADLERLGARPIDMVVCNLYPFEQTVARQASYEETVENIDIGGPSMVRSAAKNHVRVAVVCDPADYASVLEELEQGSIGLALRKRLAAKAFAHTAAYDGAIAGYLSSQQPTEEENGSEMPPYLSMNFERVATLRYGENPHQAGAWYRERNAAAGSLSCGQEVAGGRGLSFNNLVDLDAALELVREYDRPAAAVIKHTNPCGLALHQSLPEAYRLAREGDPLSAFGGIVALNRDCDLATAEIIAETFIECVVAPAFSEEARARLTKKKRLRLVAVGANPAHAGLQLKRIGGGLVVQQGDATGPGEVLHGRIVTQAQPSDAQLRSLQFAWQACKHVKSNAVVLAAGDKPQLVGVGAGQMSRVQSVLIACEKAGDRVQGSVLASDAFFPFPDGVERAAERGVVAVAQPGGSKKDADVIAACDAAGVAMVFTGHRHFRH